MKRIAFILVLCLAGCWSLPVPVAPAPSKVDSLYVIAVDSPLQRTPEQAALLTDLTYWNAVRARGHRYRNIDYGTSDAEAFKSSVDAVGGPPALIVLDLKTRKKLDAEKLPADESAIDAILKRYSDK